MLIKDSAMSCSRPRWDPGRTVKISPATSTALSAFIMVRYALVDSTSIPSPEDLMPSDTSIACAMTVPAKPSARTALHHRTFLTKASTCTGRSSSIMIEPPDLSCILPCGVVGSEVGRRVEDAEVGVYDMISRPLEGDCRCCKRALSSRPYARSKPDSVSNPFAQRMRQALLSVRSFVLSRTHCPAAVQHGKTRGVERWRRETRPASR
jgi:hypothetical protein